MVGGFIWAVSINVFTKPNLLAPGGFSGVGTVINYFFPFIPIGVSIIVLNIPLFAVVYKQFGKKFFFSGAIAMVVTSVIIDVTEMFLPVYTGNRLIAAIFGGVLSGAGLGLIYLRGIVTGGVDLMARIFEKYISFLSYGKIIACLDMLVIALAALAFKDIDTALYSAITVYISGRVVDKLLNGADSAKLILIISDKHEQIQKDILDVLHRGVTVLSGKGGYTGSDRPVMLAVCRPYEIIKVKKFIYSIDKKAFVVISDSSEVDGLGFSYTEEESLPPRP